MRNFIAVLKQKLSVTDGWTDGRTDGECLTMVSFISLWYETLKRQLLMPIQLQLFTLYLSIISNKRQAKY